MGWSRPDEDYRADHYRDEHKHEPRPSDRTPQQQADEILRRWQDVRHLDPEDRMAYIDEMDDNVDRPIVPQNAVWWLVFYILNIVGLAAIILLVLWMMFR